MGLASTFGAMGAAALAEAVIFIGGGGFGAAGLGAGVAPERLST